MAIEHRIEVLTKAKWQVQSPLIEECGPRRQAHSSIPMMRVGGAVSTEAA
jgi:hypothetical protein